MSKSCDQVCEFKGLDVYEGISNIIEMDDEEDEPEDVRGLRITPGRLIFSNCYVGQVYVKKLTFQNVDRHKIVLRILRPHSLAFKVAQEGKWIFLPAGMKAQTRISYRCTQNVSAETLLPILINGTKYEIQIDVLKGVARIRVHPTKLDFGVLDVGCPYVSKKIILQNDGVCPAVYSIEFGTNDLELVAYPRVGRVISYGHKAIQIEMTGFKAGEYLEEIWVKTKPLQRVLIQVIFIQPLLKSLHPLTTGDFTLIDIAPTINMTERYETMIIRNVSSTASTFALLAELDQNIVSLEKVSMSNRNYAQFNVTPLEGKMGPFEGKIFTVTFKPTRNFQEKGWEHKGDTYVEDFLAFVRLVRVEVLDRESGDPQYKKTGCQMTKTDDDYNLEDNYNTDSSGKEEQHKRSKEIILRLCLHGVAVKPKLDVVPDELIFDNVTIGSIIDKVITIKNLTHEVRLGYRFDKIPYFDVQPSIQFIEPKKFVDVLVRFTAHSLGSRQATLKLEMVSPQNLTDNTNIITVGMIEVKLKIRLKVKAEEQKPQLNTGITPKVTHEVGLHYEKMTYKKKLEGAKVPILLPKPTKNDKRPWLKSNDIIAFPNDRSLTLAEKPYDKRMVTPFTGKRRYIPPAISKYTLTEKEAKKKKIIQDKYTAHLATLGQKRRRALMEKDKFVNDYNYSLEQRLFNKKHMYDDVKEKPFLTCTTTVATYNYLCPLSPMALFHIKVNPKNIDFGQIPPNIDVSCTFIVENSNPFAISVKLRAEKATITIPDKAYIVGANSVTSIEIMINIRIYGKYFSNMNYVINTHHTFDMKITAVVVRRYLIVQPTSVTFKKSSEIYQYNAVPIDVTNPLSIPTSFYWKRQSNAVSAYYVEPRRGTVPGLSTITCLIHFDYNAKNFAPGSVTLVVLRGAVITVLCNYQDTGSTVCSFHPKLICTNISLGLESIREIVLFNPAHIDNTFTVMDTNPYEGIQVRPKSGIIKSRSCQVITLLLNINSVTEFYCKLRIMMNSKTIVECEVSGFVLYPDVVFQPNKVCFRQIPCLSFKTISVEMTNKSEANALVNFAMESHFQMKISTSENIRDTGVTDEGILLTPNKTKEIFLHFLPTELSSYEFYLPVILNKLIGPPNMDSPNSLKSKKYIKFGHRGRMSQQYKIPEPPKLISTVEIQCTMTEGILTFSHTELNSIIERGERGIQLFKVKNEFNKAVHFWFNIPKGPFSIRKDNVKVKVIQIEPKEELLLRAIFNPKVPGTYSVDVNVYIEVEQEIKLYNVLKLTGVFHRSSLYCADNMVYFLPVPLNVEIEKKIHLVANHQYKATKISYFVYSSSSEPIEDKCITCIYPKGNEIPATSEEFIIPVKIAFKCSKAISAIGVIKFSDGLEGSCKVGVCVTAENCTLTTHAYKYFCTDYIETISNNLMSPSISSGMLMIDEEIERKKRRGTLKRSESGTQRGRASKFRSSSHKGAHLGKDDSNATIETFGFDPVDSYLYKLFESKSLAESMIDSASDAEESIISSHKKLLLEIDEYPMFPSKHSSTQYAEYMRRVEGMVELWLYEQALQCSYRLTIGLDLFYTNAFQSALNSRSKSIYHYDIKAIKDIITKLAGKEFELTYSVPSVIPTNDVERVEVTINVYKQVISFLKMQGALMEHVYAINLLTYDDYRIYYMKLRNKPDLIYSPEEQQLRSTRAMLDKEHYESIRHQSWLDLYLQLYKTLVFYPVYTVLKGASSNLGVNCRVNASFHTDKSEDTTASGNIRFEKLSAVLIENTELKDNVNSKPETVLKNWINYIFEEKRNAWNTKDPKLNLKEREIKNFTTDLQDSVVLTAVTTYYCPFLTKLLGEFFYKPSDPVQYFHNSVLLTRIWADMRLGLTVTPAHFQKPNHIIMIFIVNHLYLHLRTYVPKTLLRLNACLSSTMKRKISIINPSDGLIKYTVCKIGDPNNHFNISTNNVIKITPQNKVDLTVCFEAKRIFPATCILMFCGSCQPGNFANNVVFELEGEASQLEIKDHYVLSIPIYKPTLINAKCSSPYLEEAEYELWYSEQEPKPGKIIMYNWNKIKDRKIPRMIYLGTGQLRVPSVHAQPSTLPLVVACCSMEQFDAWIIFSNEKAGDFIVKLSVIPRYDYIHSIFDVDLPYANCLNVPTLLCTAACPRQVHVAIPTRNGRFWETLKTMLYFTLDENEKKFWGTHFETPIGLKLIKWLLGEIRESDYKQMGNIFNTSIVYDMEIDSELVEVSPTIEVPDIHSKIDTVITFHVREKVTESFSAKLAMKSQDNSDVRVYKINFNVTNAPAPITRKRSTDETKIKSQFTNGIDNYVTCKLLMN